MADTNHSDRSISIGFQKSYHHMDSNFYELTVVMKIERGKRLFLKQYHINSSDGKSLLTKITMDQAQGKQLVAQKLLNALIFDIQN